jgi:hypothetical protein
LNEIEVNDWLKPTFKKTLFDDKKDGFRHKLFEKAKKLDKDVIDRMKLAEIIIENWQQLWELFQNKAIKIRQNPQI